MIIVEEVVNTKEKKSARPKMDPFAGQSARLLSYFTR